MRGKAAIPARRVPAARITPAHAGKSTQEYCSEDKRLGSPPRMRGKVELVGQQCIICRITPACAGKSCRWCHHRRTAWDHPRACGEKTLCPGPYLKSKGSPPRVRGKVCDRDGSILSAKGTVFKVQKGHPVPHLRQRLQVWPDHARHLRHGLILHASRSSGQGRRLCPGPCPDTAGSGTPRGPSPAKRPHTSPPAATPGGCRAWQSGATAPGSR